MGTARTRGDYATRRAAPQGRVLAPAPSSAVVTNPLDHYVPVEIPLSRAAQLAGVAPASRLERRGTRSNGKHVRRTLRACANAERRRKNGRN